MAKLPQGFVVESTPPIPEGFVLEEAGAAEPTDLTSRVRVASGGAVEGIPIVGPFIRRGAEMAAAATLAPFSDLTYSEILQQIDEETEREKAANPVLDVGSQVGGAMLSTAGVGLTGTGAKLLGQGGQTLGQRVAQSALSGGVIGAADQAARGAVGEGVDPEQVTGAGAIGAGIGGALPIVGAGVRAGVRPLVERSRNASLRARNPAAAAAKGVQEALQADKASGQALMGAEEIAAAFRNNQPIFTADLGGENIRALARAAANQAPDARASLARATSDRFADQSGRIVDMVRRAAGGAVDDLSAQEALLGAARAANRPAYRKAFTDKNAKALFTPGLQDLMQSPSLRAAVRGVPERSADRGALEGFKEIANPFTRNSQGAYVLKQQADGATATPSLQFWDQVKRNLDSMIGKAQRAGDNPRAADLMGIKKALVSELDEAVPSYAAARKGAASFFAAEDAIEAGKKFAKTTRMNPEFKRGFKAMTRAEKDAFKIGYASELIDIARSSNDRSNVIRRMFMTPEAREKLTVAFGKGGAKDFQSFVRVENAMDMLRGAFGNSTTTRQLIESGIVNAGPAAGAGGGAWWLTGDPTVGFGAAAVAAGAKAASQGLKSKINQRVMGEVADILLSNDPEAIERLVQSAARSPQTMASVDAITQIIAAGTRTLANQQLSE